MLSYHGLNFQANVTQAWPPHCCDSICRGTLCEVRWSKAPDQESAAVSAVVGNVKRSAPRLQVFSLAGIHLLLDQWSVHSHWCLKPPVTAYTGVMVVKPVRGCSPVGPAWWFLCAEIYIMSYLDVFLASLPPRTITFSTPRIKLLPRG